MSTYYYYYYHGMVTQTTKRLTLSFLAVVKVNAISLLLELIVMYLPTTIIVLQQQW